MVTLYEHSNFRGSSEEIHGDDPDLTNNRIGDNKVSSIRIRYEPVVYREPEPEAEEDGPGVIFYRGFNFSGRKQVFHRDVSDLGNSRLGNDRLSSLHIPPGYVVTLYEHNNYRGASEEITQSDGNLTDNRIGDNRVSSIRIRYEPEPEGVILFDQPGFRGQPHVLIGFFPDLHKSDIGNDTISSLRVPPGFIVTLYEHTHFAGTSEVLTGDDRNLRDNVVGDNRVSSIRIRHKDDPEPEGVILFRQANYRGKSQMFHGECASLKGSVIGSDRAYSIRVPPGCVVTLFEKDNYRGRREAIRGDDPDLSDNKIGRNRVSSLRIRYEDTSAPTPPRRPSRGQVVLYEHQDFRGLKQVLRTSLPSLRGSVIGDNTLSSIRVPPGWKVTLYSEANYRGDRLVLSQGLNFLQGTTVGNDRVSSIRVERTQ